MWKYYPGVYGGEEFSCTFHTLLLEQGFTLRNTFYYALPLITRMGGGFPWNIHGCRAFSGLVLCCLVCIISTRINFLSKKALSVAMCFNDGNEFFHFLTIGSCISCRYQQGWREKLSLSSSYFWNMLSKLYL